MKSNKATEYLDNNCQVGKSRTIIYDVDGFSIDLHSSPIEGLSDEEWYVIENEWREKTNKINEKYK